MKKPWKFTSKQVIKQYSNKRRKESKAFQFLCRQQWKQVREANRRQLDQQLSGRIEEALFNNNPHKNSAAWMLW